MRAGNLGPSTIARSTELLETVAWFSHPDMKSRGQNFVLIVNSLKDKSRVGMIIVKARVV